MRGNIVTMLLLGMFLVLALPAVSAEIEVRFPFNTDVDLKQACFNNGTYCSSLANCNISVLYPNGEILVNNIMMTNQVSFHNISFEKTQIRRLGIYNADMTCKDGTVHGKETFQIEVTADGAPSEPFPMQFSIIILGVIMIAVGKIDTKYSMFQTLGAIIVFVMGVVTVYPGYSFINYSNLAGQVIGFVGIGMGFFFLVEPYFSFDEQVENYDQADQGRF